MVNDFLSIYEFNGLISLRLFFEIMGMLHLFPYNCVFLSFKCLSCCFIFFN